MTRTWRSGLRITSNPSCSEARFPCVRQGNFSCYTGGMYDVFRENIATVASEKNMDKSLLSGVSFAFVEHAVLHTWIPEFDELVADISDEIIELLVDDISPYLYANLGVVCLVAEALKHVDPSELETEGDVHDFVDSLWLACEGETDVDFAEYVVPAVEASGWKYSAELDPDTGVRVSVSTNFD